MCRVRARVTPSLVISLIALFVALSGTAIAATGGSFILGRANTAATRTVLTSGVTTTGALGVTNTGGRPAANFTSNTGVPSISVSNGAKITNLNADKLDGIDSTGLIQGKGNAYFRGIDMGVGSGTFTDVVVPGFLSARGVCPVDTAGSVMGIVNTSTQTLNVHYAMSPSGTESTTSFAPGVIFEFSVTSARPDSPQYARVTVTSQTGGPAMVTGTLVGALDTPNNQCYYEFQLLGTSG